MFKGFITACRFFPICRSRLQKGSQNIDDADEERENDLGDVVVDQDFEGNCHFSEVVGLYT